MTLKIDGRHSHLGLSIVSLVRENRNQAKDVDMALEPSKDLISVNQQGGTDFFVAQDL